MKRLLVSVASITLGLGLGACGESDPEETGEETAASESESPSTGEDASTTDVGPSSSTSGTPTTSQSESESESESESASDTESESESESESGDEETSIVPLMVNGFDVPTAETYYGCFEFGFNLTELGHVVGFKANIDNAAHVHHFVLTMIDEPTGAPDGYSCFDLSGDMIWAWAPGDDEFMLPPEAGFLIGDKPGGQVTLRLQVHYNNPLGVADQVDSSGLDLIVTTDLRPNNAGTLVFGDIEGISIPPGESAYEHIMTCRSEVTADRFENPLNVFGSSMHAHDIGSVLWTDVMRNGEKVMELNRDDPFDFNNQSFKPLETVLMPGDEIVNHCIYDSTGREETTRGGPGTLDEMCWDTIMYYPKISSGFDYCSSND